MGLIKSNMPCLPCLLTVSRIRLPSVQHVVEGRKRLGHEFTYAMCEWHHFGTCFPGHTRQQMMGLLGPSITQGSHNFRAFFGPERQLVRIQDMLLERFAAQPWIDYAMPYTLRREAFHEWTYQKSA